MLECLVARTVLTHDVGIGVLRDLLGNEQDNFAGPGNELFLESGSETGDAIIPSRGRISMIQKQKKPAGLDSAGFSCEL